MTITSRAHSLFTGFSTEELAAPEDFAAATQRTDLLLLPGCCNDAYQAGFACSPRSIEEALRLRYRVFNVELDEGLASSAQTGMDRDDFDDQMTHLVLIERESGLIAGTYRLQTATDALAAKGLYSSGEFDLRGLDEFLGLAVECGRACIEKEHRNFAALAILWSGISAYLKITSRRYLFGCCSLTSSDPDDGWRCMKALRKRDCLHPSLRARALPGCSCGPEAREFEPGLEALAQLPKLFRIYLRLGTEVISEPAIDREFGTVDFLIWLDTQRVNEKKLYGNAR